MESIVDVKYVAKLAQIEISNDELLGFEKDIKNIIGMFNNLPSLEKSKTVIDKNNPMELRCDEVVSANMHNDILKLAPQQIGGYVAIPKIAGGIDE